MKKPKNHQPAHPASKSLDETVLRSVFGGRRVDFTEGYVTEVKLPSP